MGRTASLRVGTAIRRGLTVMAIAGIAVAMPAGAAATVTGGCTLIATSTSGGSVDLASVEVWHLRSTDHVSVTATAPTPQTDITVTASALGLAIPIASSHLDGSTSIGSAEYEVSTLAMLGRVFVVGGSSSGPAGGCAGQVRIVIDDASPLLSVLGAAAVAACLLGLLGIAWAVRNPTGLRRRILGLVALLMIGGGVALLLQQASPLGGPWPADAGRSAFVASVADPGRISLDPGILAQSAILTLVVVLLMPFPSELFNRTLEANHEEIRASLGRLPLVGRLVGAPRPPGTEEGASAGFRRLLGIAAFVLVSGLLYGLLDPTFGLDARSLVTYVGILAALLGVTWAAALPQRAIQRVAAGDSGRLRAVPGTLAIAATCVLISRLTGFVPGYLYGLILGYTFATRLDSSQEGRASALSAWWILALAFASWLMLGAVRSPGIQESVPGTILESVLAALVVAGIEGIALGLVPLRYLQGELILRWKRSVWAVLYAIGIFGFLHVVLGPGSAYLVRPDQVSFLTAAALFVGFGLVSVLFWGYFRFRPARTTV